MVNSGYIKSRQILNDTKEIALMEYIKKAADIYYGLTSTKGKKIGLSICNKKTEIKSQIFGMKRKWQ